MSTNVNNKKADEIALSSPKKESEFATMCFNGFVNCVFEMWKDLKDEGCYFDKGELKGAGGRTFPIRPKYTPYRIREEERP